MQDLRGKIICFDGIDGSGKSTQIQLVGKYLEEKGYDVVYTRQPGISGVGTHIRNALFDETNINNRVHDFWAKRLLFVAEYREFIDRYRSDIYKDKVILCDRSILSSNPAYGGAELLGDYMEVLRKTVPLYEDLADKAPDMIILFDISVSETLTRLSQRKEGNYYDVEDARFKVHCENIFKLLPNIEEMMPDLLGLSGGSDIFRTINARGDVNQTFNNIIDKLKEVYEICE